MVLIEAHGLLFSVEIDGLLEQSDLFTSVSHNVRQQLLSIEPATLRDLHSACLARNPGECSDVLRLGNLAERAAGLSDGFAVRVSATAQGGRPH